jgi:hypothetical protein
MENRISLVMVADDRLFLAQAEKAAEKAGKSAGEKIGRTTKKGSDQILNNWELPIAEVVVSNEVKGTAAEESEQSNNTSRITRKSKRRQSEPKVKNRKIRDALSEEFGIQKPVPGVLPIDGIRPSKKKTKASPRGSITEALKEEFGIQKPVPEVLPIDGVKPSKRKPSSRSNNSNTKPPTSLAEEALRKTAEERKKRDENAIIEKQNANRFQDQDAKVREQDIENAAALTGNPDEKIRLQFEAKKEAVNRKRDDTRADLIQQYDKLSSDRDQAIISNDVETANSYARRMTAAVDLTDQNEKLRESELRILEIQKAQALVISKRKGQDSRIDDTRSRRDVKLKDDENQRVSDLQNQRSNLKDPVAVATLNRNINQTRAEFKRTRENNKIDDESRDLNTNESRVTENRRIGINDPKLDNIDFKRERKGLVDRRQRVKDTFELSSQAAENTLQSTVNTQAKKTQEETNRIDYSEKISKLRSELANTSDEVLKVKIQFQLDLAGIEENYRKIEGGLTTRLTGLKERQAALENTGQPNGGLNQQIEQAQKQIEEVKTNKAEALRLSTENSLVKAGVAEFSQGKKRTVANSLLEKPEIALNEKLASNLLDKGQNLEAAMPGRSAALAKEQSRYKLERSDFQTDTEKARASGVQIPQEKVNTVLAAIDRLNAINIEGITQKFNNLAGSISASNLELRNIAQNQTTSFLADLIGGVDTFDKIWKKAVKGVVDGMIQILAQKFSATLTDGAGSQGSGGGLIGKGVGLISKILNFDDGGVISGQSHKSYSGDKSPIARALREEGAGATVVVGKQGERILNLGETAKYHALYPNGIMNANRGGIIGSGINTNIQSGGSSQAGGTLGGRFAVDLSTNGQPQTTANEYMSNKLTQAMRAIIVEESRENGIIDRMIRR